MQINKIQINGFGKLKDVNMELQPGVNLIYGNNEAGKSTIADFIRVIFYGVNKNKNGNAFSDYEKYLPWDGSSFGGTIEYLHDTHKYNLHRDFKNNKATIHDEFNNDISDDFSKNKAKGAEIGFEQFGIDEDTFENSILVRQNQTKVDTLSQNSIIQKLGNAIQTGDESLSYDELSKKLEAILKDEVGTDRATTKPKFMLKKELNYLEVRETELESNRNKTQLIKEQIEELKNKQKEIEEELDLEKQIFSIKEKYENEISKEKIKYDLEQKTKKELADARAREIRNKKIIDSVLILTVSALVAIVFLIKALFPNMIIAILFGIIATIVNLKVSYKEEIVVDTGNFDLIVEDIKKKRNKELSQFDNNIKAQPITERSISELNKIISENDNNIKSLDLQIHKLLIDDSSLKKDLDTLNDIVETLAYKREEYDKLLKKEKIMNIGINVLKESYEEIKKRIIPQIEEDIKYTIAKTTNGKYEEILYNDEQGLLAKNEYGQIVSLDKLSVGTMDQIYLGFRLAVADKYSDLPLIFDETFVYYDDVRLENFFKTLSEVSNDKQIIILSCSNREEKILEKLNIKFAKNTL